MHALTADRDARYRLRCQDAGRVWQTTPSLGLTTEAAGTPTGKSTPR